MEGENEWTESTLRQVDHMNDLIKNLVLLSRSEETVDRSAMAEINITDALRETVKTFTPVATQAGRTLTGDIQDEIRIVADSGTIEQLASLLIDNAIKYCDEGGTVSVNAAKKGKGLRLVVSNTYAEGKNQDYSRFFDRFYRAHNSGVNIKGTGLGLAIVKLICDKHDAEINVTSTLGKGTKFEVIMSASY
jgi:signal transduction histidine kinase